MEIYKLAAKDLDLEVTHSDHSTDNEKFKTWLIQEIQLMIDQDFPRFAQSLYRLDIDEQKAKEAFTLENPAVRFFELIVERELQKIASRKKYS